MTSAIGCGKDGDKSIASTQPNNASVKLGYIVKQPDEPWFQNEWTFAQQAADADGFSLVKIGAVDGEKVLAAIDNLAAQGVQGFVICTPDVKLGPAIKARADAMNLKLYSVDDRLLGSNGEPMNDVPYMGISAHEIGKAVGSALSNEMKKRGWSNEDTYALAVTFDELETARQRVDGAVEALTHNSFPADHIFRTPEKTTDIPGGFDAANALLTQHGAVKHWLVFSMNDEGVLGGVRALEGRGFDASNTIGVGIGGSTGAVEFQKDKPTGFFASVLISPKRHGRETTDQLYHWVKDSTPPPMTTLTAGKLITRDDYKKIMTDEGLPLPG